MRRLPFQDEWLEGMRNEDGVQLMESLMKEPGLVSVTYRGCNVLHLAVRHNWYGLVLEILDRRKFNIPNIDAKDTFRFEQMSALILTVRPAVSRIEDVISKVDTKGSASAKGVSAACSKGSGSLSEKGDGIPVDVKGSAEGVFPVCSEGAGPESWGEDGNSCHALDLTRVTINLLTAREGDGTDVYYSSGLDVLAMAEIQCHHAINSALAKFIWDVRFVLGKGHPYRFYAKPSDKKIDFSRVPSGPDDEFKESAKEALRRYVREYFPDSSLEEWICLDEAPNCTSRTDTMSDTSLKGSRSSDLEFHSRPLIVRQWMVTAPFLSLSEYLFLEGNRTWGFSNLQVGLRQDKDRILLLGSIIMLFVSDPLTGSSTDLPPAFGISFVKYLMDITDTRRTAFHYGLISGIWVEHWKKLGDVSSPVLKLYSYLLESKRSGDQRGAKDEILKEFEARFSMTDGAGRSFVHTLLASDLNLSWTDGLFSELWPSFNLDNLRECPDGRWYFRHKSWKTNVTCVYAANGLHGWHLFGRIWTVLQLSADKIVLTSPHLSPWQKVQRLTWLLARESFKPTLGFPRVLLHDGGVKKEVIMTSLKYAVLVGDHEAVELLAKDKRMYDTARIDNVTSGDDDWDSIDRLVDQLPLEGRLLLQHRAINCEQSSLYLAAEQGEAEMIRTILETSKFDPHNTSSVVDGQTILHAAVYCQEPHSVPVMLHDFVEIPRMATNLPSNLSKPEVSTNGTTEHAGKQSGQYTIGIEQQREKELDRESSRQGCVNFLIQVGLDAWQPDERKKIADPGPRASRGYKTWWYDKLERETQNQKAGFGVAANALSVTAALVATASYIGPLQPPLGYNLVDEVDNVSKVQVDILPVRIFVVCNNLAFFFAVVAIMLSLTPSLSMPKESMLEELKRMRRSITLALIALIVSMTAILTAFASAIIAVIPNQGSWNSGGLSISTLVIGGPLCLFVLVFCGIRAIRLFFHNNIIVRRFYGRWVFI